MRIGIGMPIPAKHGPAVVSVLVLDLDETVDHRSPITFIPYDDVSNTEVSVSQRGAS